MNISALVLYFGLFVGLPVVGLVALFIGMVATNDAGGPMFIPIVIAGAGVYLVVAVGVGLVLSIISALLWRRTFRKEKEIGMVQPATAPYSEPAARPPQG